MENLPLSLQFIIMNEQNAIDMINIQKEICWSGREEKKPGIITFVDDRTVFSRRYI